MKSASESIKKRDEKITRQKQKIEELVKGMLELKEAWKQMMIVKSRSNNANTVVDEDGNPRRNTELLRNTSGHQDGLIIASSQKMSVRGGAGGGSSHRKFIFGQGEQHQE